MLVPPPEFYLFIGSIDSQYPIKKITLRLGSKEQVLGLVLLRTLPLDLAQRAMFNLRTTASFLPHTVVMWIN